MTALVLTVSLHLRGRKCHRLILTIAISEQNNSILFYDQKLFLVLNHCSLQVRALISTKVIFFSHFYGHIKDANISLFPVPEFRIKNITFPTRYLAKWLDATGNQKLREKSPQELHKSYRVCSLHFTNESFKRTPLRRILWPNAVPTLRLRGR